jgi:hypothetical protein
MLFFSWTLLLNGLYKTAFLSAISVLPAIGTQRLMLDMVHKGGLVFLDKTAGFSRQHLRTEPTHLPAEILTPGGPRKSAVFGQFRCLNFAHPQYP